MTWLEGHFNKIVLVAGPILIAIFAWRLAMSIEQLEEVCLIANLVLWVPVVASTTIDKIREKQVKEKEVK